MLELNLASHFEAEADPQEADYEYIQAALGNKPLYHQWCTYRAKEAALVVNSYNTGTGKTKAALLRLLDLNQRQGNPKQANVLFIAPTNELLRQHEEDVKSFIEKNKLRHLVLRLDAQKIKDLGIEYLGEKYVRQGDRLRQMLEDPGSVLPTEDGYHPEGKKPYVLITNPDIFYYALYGLGNQHDQRLLFRLFIGNFNYIIVDEFHYYNAKQLANFLFFLTLSREWGYFEKGRQVCLLTATPVPQVTKYIENLNVAVKYIKPDEEPLDLPRTPALAPIRLRLYSGEALGGAGSDGEGLVGLASREFPTVSACLKDGQHGAIISSALWQINRLYEKYGSKANALLGRLTGAESSQWRKLNQAKALIMATPTVDIGYNFGRAGKDWQSLDFLLFDARTSDEFIQRLGRAGRVLGKKVTDRPSEVWAVVPDELLTALQPFVGQTIERPSLNKLVSATLPPKNGLYSYVRSGAIAEAFLPIYAQYGRSLPPDLRERAHQVYDAVCEVYEASKNLTYKSLEFNIRRYLKISAKKAQLLKEINATSFEFGSASLLIRTMDKSPQMDEIKLEEMAQKYEADAPAYKQAMLSKYGRSRLVDERQAEIEEYFRAEARFNFRDNFQPPQVLVHDAPGLLASAEYTVYSALHLVQNFEGDWSDAPQLLEEWEGHSLLKPDQGLPLAFELRKTRQTRLYLYFYLNRTDLSEDEWKEGYCSKLAATTGFQLRSDDGPVPAEINKVFRQKYLTFYAVPAVGPEARTLNSLSRHTALYSSKLKVDLDGASEKEYLIVLGSAALQLSCEGALRRASHVAQRAAAKANHIFDWEC